MISAMGSARIESRSIALSSASSISPIRVCGEGIWSSAFALLLSDSVEATPLCGRVRSHGTVPSPSSPPLPSLFTRAPSLLTPRRPSPHRRVQRARLEEETDNVVPPDDVETQLVLLDALVQAVHALDRVGEDDVGRLVEPLELADDGAAVLGDDQDLLCRGRESNKSALSCPSMGECFRRAEWRRGGG